MKTDHIYRTAAIRDIHETDIGQTIKAAGWVENIRDHGGVSFIDLRDRGCFGETG